MQRVPSVNISGIKCHRLFWSQWFPSAAALFFCFFAAARSGATDRTGELKVELVAADVPPTARAGGFAPPGERVLRYRLGWSGLTAARLEARLAREDGALCITGRGGTTGLARVLYRVDFDYASELSVPDFALRSLRLEETYRGAKVINRMRLAPGGIVLSRGTAEADSGGVKERFYAVNDAVDMTGALLRFRSLPLNPGDRAAARVCHGDRLYLAVITVKGRETRVAAGRRRPVIRVELALSKIGKKGLPEPHEKFRSATGWFSDDEQRDLLRVEGEVFIGFLFAELEEERGR